MDGFSLTQVQAHAIVEMRLRSSRRWRATRSAPSTRTSSSASRSCGRSSATRRRSWGSSRTSSRRSPTPTATSAGPRSPHAEGEIDIEDLIADQQMVITITKSGYIKSLPLATYRNQRRGGVGVTGMDMKDGDYIEHLFVCSTHDYLLFFTNRGKIYRSKVYELPEAQRTAKGRALDNFLPLREGERVQAVHRHARLLRGPVPRVRDEEGPGQEDRVPRLQHADQGRRHHRHQDPRRRRARGRAPDHAATTTSSWSRARGRRPASTRTRRAPMGRDTGGVRGMNVSQKGNGVLAMDVARDDTELLVVTENGYGKRTPVPDYPRKNPRDHGRQDDHDDRARRASSSARWSCASTRSSCSSPRRAWCSAPAVKGISSQGRPAQGVRLMNLRDDDVVSRGGVGRWRARPTRAAPVADRAARTAGARRRRRRRPNGEGGPDKDLRGLLQSSRPGKGGGPTLSDSLFGTLEVTGR